MLPNKQINYLRQKLGFTELIERPNFSIDLVLDEAEKIGINWEHIPETQCFKLSYKGQVKHILDRTPESTSAIAYLACLDKNTTKAYLKSNGISTTVGLDLRKNDTKDYWLNVFNHLPKPLVVKPTHASRGDSVYMGIRDFDAFSKAVEASFKARMFPDAGVVVEEEFIGNEYRVMANKNKVLAIMQRIPANIIGDGTHTLQELIAMKNNSPLRGDGKPYPKIKIDQDLKNCIEKQYLSLDFIPEAGQQVFLRTISNLSQGGDGIDFTDQAHPSVKEICIKAVNSIPGLSFAGIDFITKNIEIMQTPDSYQIIEINSNSDFTHHHYPMKGNAQPVALEFLRTLFENI